MKHYKDFGKIWIGYSDIATLICSGYSAADLKVAYLPLGEDGSYRAYWVPEEEVEIGEHYRLLGEWKSWLNIYDDTERTVRIEADCIRVYYSGRTALLQAWNEDGRAPIFEDR